MNLAAQLVQRRQQLTQVGNRSGAVKADGAQPSVGHCHDRCKGLRRGRRQRRVAPACFQRPGTQ